VGLLAAQPLVAAGKTEVSPVVGGGAFPVPRPPQHDSQWGVHVSAPQASSL